MTSEGTGIAAASSSEDQLRLLKPSDLLGSVFTMLAIVTLIRQGISTHSLSAPMQAVLDAYEAGKHILFSWAEPYLRQALSFLGGLFSFKITLYTHWRDIFLLSMLLIISFFRSGILSNSKLDRQTVLSYVGPIVGSLFASVLVGTIDPNSGVIIDQYLIGILPIPIVVVFAFGFELFEDKWGFVILGVPAILSTLATTALFKAGVPLKSIGLGANALLLIVLGLFFIIQGRIVDEPPTVRLGVYILNGFLGAAVFFAIDAGIKIISA